MRSVSKIWMILFLSRAHRWETWVQSSKVSPKLKLKMSLFADITFSISARPPGGIFPLWFLFSNLWTFGQKSITSIQIFHTLWIDKNDQQLKDGCFWASCISGTLNWWARYKKRKKTSFTHPYSLKFSAHRQWCLYSLYYFHSCLVCTVYPCLTEK